MKQLYTLVIILFSIINMFAQNNEGLIIRPNTGEFDVDPMGFETVAEAYLVNLSEDTLVIRWIRTVNELSTGWSSAICDFNACWSTVVDSTGITNVPDLTLAPGDSSNLDVHIRPAGVDGEALVSVKAFALNIPDLEATSTYGFNRTLTNSTNLALKDIKIYPNPTTSFIQLTENNQVARMSVHSLVGKEMKNFVVYPGGQYNVSDLPNGIYTLRMYGQHQQPLRTVRLVKE